jgi:pimeloyl-ACP methyl ester carboxylesterase
MNSSAIPEGPGSVFGAPRLPDGFAGTFTSRYADTSGLRQHVVTGYAVGHYIDTLATDPAALHASFAIHRALDATIAQNQQRKTQRLQMPVLAIGGEKSLGDQVAGTMKLTADDVQTLVIPGCGHHPPEEAPEETLTALTGFLAPYPGEHAAASVQRGETHVQRN